MLPLLAHAAPFDANSNIKKESSDKRRKNKTLKRIDPLKSQVQSMINDIHRVATADDNNSSLSDFNPNINEVTDDTPAYVPPQTLNDDPVTLEAFNSLSNNYNKQYYDQTVPLYNNNSSNSDVNSINTTSNAHLLEKLDHIIHLLKENKDEKTDTVTEELILYSFLGIFIIFVIDSFARASKYVR